ncbi:MAG: hypothetical protein K8S54_03255 [Spirochaetia bacterium]|nr:hypothetical protein [Spirochaetia bacterium]
MVIKFWGVRSDLPSPLSSQETQLRMRAAVEIAVNAWKAGAVTDVATMQLEMPVHIRSVMGGETSCIEVTDSDDGLIIDLGTGARRLGYDLLARGAKGQFYIVLTGTRWDHIQGWPFFTPGYIPGNSFRIFSSAENMRERMERQQDFSFFPVRFNEMASTRDFTVLNEEAPRDAGAFRLRAIPSYDPISSDSVRIECRGKVLVLAGPDTIQSASVYADFLHGADILILQDVRNRSILSDLVDRIKSLGIKRVILTDHIAAMGDLEAIETAAKAGVELAREELTVEI